MGGLFTFFITGTITTNINIKEWGKTTISATGGLAVFVLTFFGLLQYDKFMQSHTTNLLQPKNKL
jgi:hypothetical protein